MRYNNKGRNNQGEPDSKFGIENNGGYRRSKDPRDAKQGKVQFGERFYNIRDFQNDVDVSPKDPVTGPEGEPKIGEKSSFLAKKTMKDLKAGSLMLAGTPYTDALTGDEPYAYLADYNKVIGADYKGVDNITGNVLAEINDPNNGVNLYNYDEAYTQVVMNYRFINRPTDKTQYMNNQYGKVMDQLASQVEAELLKDLDFFQDDWETDMLHLDSANRYAAIFYYETGFMNIIAPIQAFNTLLAMQPTLMQMEYLRGAPQLKSLFAQLNKTTMIENVNGIGTNLPGEFLDMDWLKTVSTMVSTPCRKANDKFHPLMSINATHWMPELRQFHTAGNSRVKVFDSADLTITLTTSAFGTKSYNLQTLAADLLTLLAPGRVLTWARQYARGMISTTAKEYTNNIETLVNGMQQLGVRFSQSMGTVRTFFERVKKSAPDMLGVTVGHGFTAGRVPNFELRMNVMTANIIQGVVCVPDDLHYDTDIKAWVFSTMWDRAYGVAEFDLKTGGAFLSAAIRSMPNRESGEDGTEAKWALPIGFSHSGAVTVSNMKGSTIRVEREQLTADQIRTNNKFARLVLTPDSAKPMSVAYFSWGNNTLDPLEVSKLSYVMVELFGLSHQHRNDTIWIGDNSTDDYDCENSLIGAVDMQRVSLANALTTYARSQGPIIQQSLPSEMGGIGFKAA